MKHSYTISKDGFLLRPLFEEDLMSLVKWRNQEEIRNKFLDNNPISIEGQQPWFNNYLLREGDIMFVIEADVASGQPVGTVALYNIDREKGTADFGRLMIGNSKARGSGLGLRVTNAVCEFGFNTIGISRIHLEVLTNNHKAKHIYQRCGFSVLESYESSARVLKMLLTDEGFITL